MARASILYENLADDGLVTSSSALLKKPAANVQTPDVGESWQSQTTSASLYLDLHAVTQINTVAVIGLVATSARIRASSTDPTCVSADVLDTTMQSVDQLYLQHLAILDESDGAQYIRVDLVNAGGEDYCRIGRLVVGLRSTYSFNFGYGWSFTNVDPSVRSETLGGQIKIELRNIYRVLEMPFERIEDEDRETFVEEIDRMNCLHKDVLVIKDSDGDNLAFESIWGLISDATPIFGAGEDYSSKILKVRERL